MTKRLPRRCVVDTNVTTIANGANDGAPADCVAASARALREVMARGCVYIDDAGLLMDEYRRNLRAGGQPGAGDAFLKWLLTHEWDASRVTRVRITPRPGDPDEFEELPNPERYDPSDRKFLAVAVAHPDKPQLLQSFDSKWWGWQGSLSEVGVTIHFLCEGAIARKFHEKIGG